MLHQILFRADRCGTHAKVLMARQSEIMIARLFLFEATHTNHIQSIIVRNEALNLPGRTQQ